jgi:hypothetical protein
MNESRRKLFVNEDFITFEFINLRMIMKISRLNFPAKIPVY